MIKYAKVVNNNGECMVLFGDDIEWAVSQGYSEQDVELSDVDSNWYLSAQCPHLTPEEKEAREQEHISHLKMTKRVCALMLQQLDIPYSTLKEAIETNEQAQLEWDLCVELERCNPLINVIGATFGLSSAQIDQMFKYANGEVDTLEVE